MKLLVQRMRGALAEVRVELKANLKSISHRCHLFEVAFVWELTQETIDLPLGCLQGGCEPASAADARARWWWRLESSEPSPKKPRAFITSTCRERPNVDQVIQTHMAQGRSTKIISMTKWIRTSRLSTKNSLLVEVRDSLVVEVGVEGAVSEEAPRVHHFHLPGERGRSLLQKHRI